jgi:hypothetical protein
MAESNPLHLVGAPVIVSQRHMPEPAMVIALPWML